MRYSSYIQFIESSQKKKTKNNNETIPNQLGKYHKFRKI